MNRRTLLERTGGVSALAALPAGVAVNGDSDADSSDEGDGSDRRNGDSDDDGRPTVRSVESEAKLLEDDGTRSYAVEYGEDGTVKITGRTVAPTPCHEVDVDGVVETGRGDLVDLTLVDPVGFCVQALAAVRYAVELEYDDADAVPDVFVSVPERAGR